MRASLALAFCALLTLAACATDSSKRSEKPKFALVGFNPSVPPMSSLEDGQLKGASVEIAKIVISSIPTEVRVTYAGPWNDVLNQAKEGKLDFVMGVFKTADRQAYLDFSIPYYSVPVSVCVKDGAAFPFTRWDDLMGRRGLMGIGESYGQDFDSFATEHLNITRMPLKDCFTALVEGRADYLVVGQMAGMTASWQYGVDDDVEFLDIPVTTQSYHIAVSKLSPFREDLAKVNQRILALNVEGTAEHLVAKGLIMWKNKEILHTPTKLVAPTSVLP
jgi:polar amino acid transport system substrate-binding protein